ncbi:MAG: sensor histidine kinase [Variovorax sp.]
MRLSEFITARMEPILKQWSAFAATSLPAAAEMSEQALRDHAAQMLNEIAVDIRRPQDENQRLQKSQGNEADSPRADAAARAHALQRARNGFETEQMVAEYRALRATVLRLWAAEFPADAVHDLEDVIRFNEAIDAALASSLKVFLVEVDRTRDLFLGVLGHDLRGPLGVIASCAQLDRKTQPDNARAVRVLQNVAHMRALLDDLVEYARNRLGAKAALQRTSFDLGVFTSETVDAILSVAPGRRIEVRLSGDLHGWWDYHRLHQVLANLIYNALKYGKSDELITVTAEELDSSEQLLLSVHNPGAPLPKALMENLFEPLVRYDDGTPSETQAGANMGLGLYAAHEITSAHGGTISVTSNEGGTRFAVLLPRGEASSGGAG